MRVSEHWSRSYDDKLINFDHWLSSNYSIQNSLTQDIVDQYCSVRPTETINSCLARTNVVIALIRYMQKRGLSDVKEPDRPRPQKCTHLPHAFTPEELTRFFYECDHIKVDLHRKDAVIHKLILCVIFRLMYSTGIRPNEARELKRSEVDLQECVLNIVQTKGHDQHYVPIHETMVEILKEYDQRMGILVPGRIYFFPKGSSDYWSEGWLRKWFATLWKKANPSSTHTISYDFRHNFAIVNINKWIGEGFDFYNKLYYLSKCMGHCNVNSTKYYYSIVPQLADILEEKTSSDFDDLIPEVQDEYW